MKSHSRIDSRFKRLLVMAAVSAGIAMYSVTAAYALDGDDQNGEEVESYYQNPAQAAHAANLADEAAINNADVQKAYDDYQAAIDNNEPSDVVEALEKAYLDTLADVTGTLSGDIAAMREADMGWGEIAHELGVHPSVLGLGNKFGMKAKNKNANAAMFGDEISEATARNTRTGNAKGHGLGLGAASGPSGKGLGLGKDKEGKVGGAAGLGAGRGKSGASGGPGNNNAGGLGGSKGNSKSGPGNSNAGGLGGSKGNSNSGPGNSNAGGNGKGGGNAGGNGKGGGKK